MNSEALDFSAVLASKCNFSESCFEQLRFAELYRLRLTEISSLFCYCKFSVELPKFLQKKAG